MVLWSGDLGTFADLHGLQIGSLSWSLEVLLSPTLCLHRGNDYRSGVTGGGQGRALPGPVSNEPLFKDNF